MVVIRKQYGKGTHPRRAPESRIPLCSASNSAVTGSWNGDSFQHERKCLLEPPYESPFFCFVLPTQRDRNADFLPAHGGEGPEHRRDREGEKQLAPTVPRTATRPGEESMRSADPRKFPGEQLAVSMAALPGPMDYGRLFPVI